MIEQEVTPFSPFGPAPSPSEPTQQEQSPKTSRRKKGPKKGGKRASRAAATDAAARHDPGPEPAKRARKPRQPRPATVPVELLVVASGLDERAAQVLAGVVQALSQLRKPSRRRLVEALQKLS